MEKLDDSFGHFIQNKVNKFLDTIFSVMMLVNFLFIYLSKKQTKKTKY